VGFIMYHHVSTGPYFTAGLCATIPVLVSAGRLWGHLLGLPPPLSSPLSLALCLSRLLISFCPSQARPRVETQRRSKDPETTEREQPASVAATRLHAYLYARQFVLSSDALPSLSVYSLYLSHRCLPFLLQVSSVLPTSLSPPGTVLCCTLMLAFPSCTSGRDPASSRGLRGDRPA
jgi:hypothetical protein